MDVLVIGGSVFVGRAVVDEALTLGADVTVFNRGVSGTVPGSVTQVTGDRTVAADLEQLRGRTFDLVVDTSGYVPADVRDLAAVVEPSVGHYAFVSSVNAFSGWPYVADYHASGLFDGDPDATRDDVPPELDEPQPYGWLKVGCERAVERAFGPQRCSILRGGLLVGPHDAQVARLPWWIARVAAGGEILVPGTPDAPIATVDARDLARFALDAAPGTFETTGPPRRDTWGDLLTACLAATGADAELTWVADGWLAEQPVQPWAEIPLWIAPETAPGLWRHDTDTAETAGLRWRPLTETVADTWAWMRDVPGGWTPSEMTPGLARDRERELLAQWHSRA